MQLSRERLFATMWNR